MGDIRRRRRDCVRSPRSEIEGDCGGKAEGGHLTLMRNSFGKMTKEEVGVSLRLRDFYSYVSLTIEGTVSAGGLHF